MTQKFMKVNNGSTITGVVFRRGCSYMNRSFGKNSPDNTYIAAGLYPIVENEKPLYDIDTGKLKDDYVLDGLVVNHVWTIELFDIDRIKEIKLAKIKESFKLNTRPRVTIILDSGAEIEIDGGRVDKDNFKEEHARLVRSGETTGEIKDADNVRHVSTTDDLKTAYEAIVDNYSVAMKLKWDSQTAVTNCDTIECLNLLDIK